MFAEIYSLLRGAYDIHVHCTPDVVPRAQDAITLARTAKQAGMAGVLLKNHTTSTAGLAYTLNQMDPDGPRFFGALALNPPVGGLNPFAVQAALRCGADVIYFPTYGARYQIAVMGPDAFPSAYPRPGGRSQGIAIIDSAGALKPEVGRILDLIAEYDAVLATGHLSPAETLILLKAAQQHGVRRAVVTHASEAVPGLSIDEQREAVTRGAFIEHCLLALTEGYSRTISAQELGEQIHGVGAEHVILSSDLGQAANGPPVVGFARLLGGLQQSGLGDDELRAMIVDNPRRLLADRGRGPGPTASSDSAADLPTGHAE